MASRPNVSSTKPKKNKAKSHIPRKDTPTDAIATKTTSTRLCLKNIPASFSSLQLRDYLKKEYKRRSNNNEELIITDCRVLLHPQKKTSRRIAFTGFQSPQMAQKVVQLFHQTFALTSRLQVEFAHTSNMEKKEDTTSKDTTKTAKDLPIRKIKKDTTKSQIMAGAGSSKAKFWANDMDLVESAKEVVEEATRSKEDAEDDNDDASSSSSSSSSDSSDDEADPLVKTTKPKLSDMDFLKSKQKMVDDLDVVEASPSVEKEKKEQMQEDDTESSDSDDSSTTSASEAPVPDQKAIEDTTKAGSQDDAKVEEDAAAKDNDDNNDDNLASDRLFVRNLPFTTTEEELEHHFATFGSVRECHIPVDDRKMSKGFAFVTFDSRQDAARALETLDGTDFQGRFLHILPSRQKPKTQDETPAEDHNDRPLSYKERQELARRQDANKSATGWSASFVRGDAVVDSLADRLGLKKGDILNVKEGLSSGDAAVRLALGETQIIEENRAYFVDHGIDMEALVSAKGPGASSKRSTTSLLVKNLPYDTLVEELNKVFHGVGDAPKRILLPPSRTIALVEYSHSSDAKRAFRKLAYRRFKSVPLYLEWAPMDAIESSTNTTEEPPTPQPIKEETVEEEEESALEGPTPSIYVKNLNFSTSEEKLQKYFDKAVGDVRAVRIPTKLAPVKKPRVGSTSQNDGMQSLSMGFGFVEFASHEAAAKALRKLQGSLLDGHALELKPSTKSLTQQVVIKVPASKKNPTKITVRNVPFQASRTEILKLFGSFGQLKRVRLPKKFNGGHRGFAFVEFVTHKEALAAMKALSRTHLYGRHLVLEWAEDDSEDSAMNLDSLRQKAQRDVELGGDKGRVNKRQKFS